MSFRRRWIIAFATVSTLTVAATADATKRGQRAQLGIQTPGIQIPASKLKAEAEIKLDAPPSGMTFNDAGWVVNASGMHRIDPKTNNVDSSESLQISRPCGGIVTAFRHAWTTACESELLTKIQIRRAPVSGPRPSRANAEVAKPDPETSSPAAPAIDPGGPVLKIAATVPSSRPTAPLAIAASADSIWLLADPKTTLQRIDPVENRIVAESRLPANCTALLFGEGAVWAACPETNKLLRIDARTNLVDKRIDVPGEPYALVSGAGAIWVLCRRDCKVVRVDAKTNKVVATLDLMLPGRPGSLAFGDESLWVSMPDFPLTRIVTTPEKERVAQQFYGAGGGLVYFGLSSVWIGSPESGALIRYDPKRVLATLPD